MEAWLLHLMIPRHESSLTGLGSLRPSQGRNMVVLMLCDDNDGKIARFDFTCLLMRFKHCASL